MSVESLVPFLVLALPLAVILLALRFQRAQTEARYRTLVQLAEKGVALPSEALAGRRRPEEDRRRGIVLLALGIGLMLGLWALPLQVADGQRIGAFWGIGLLPLTLGLGYLINWWLDTRTSGAHGAG